MTTPLGEECFIFNVMTPKAAVYNALAITLYYSSNLNISFDYKTPVNADTVHFTVLSVLSDCMGDAFLTILLITFAFFLAIQERLELKMQLLVLCLLQTVM